MLHLAQVVKAAVAGEMWPQAELPRQVADSRQRLWQPGWQGRPKQSDGSAGGPQKSQNTADSRRLSRAIGSEVAHDFTWLDIQAHPVHGQEAAVALHQAVYRKGGVHPAPLNLGRIHLRPSLIPPPRDPADNALPRGCLVRHSPERKA